MNHANMAMAGAGIGGPVGTPGGPGLHPPENIIKKLNTAIYEYLLCNEKYEIARLVYKELQIETTTSIKQSPGQRGNQANGAESIDLDHKGHPGVRGKPDDLPTPASMHPEDNSFLQDWWFQFWELYNANRQRGKPNAINYVGNHRTNQKTRQGMMNMANGDMQGMRGFGNLANGNMDLRQAALKNAKMNPQNMAQMRATMANANQPNPMQGAQMERQSSQMDMSGPRSGSPHNGDAPSPKRQRTGENNMSQMSQGRPGQPGQMQANQVGPPNNIPPSPESAMAQMRQLALSKGFNAEGIQGMDQDQLQKLSLQPNKSRNNSLEVYSGALHQQTQAALRRTNSNAIKGIPPNNGMGPGGQQSSPMSQPGIEASSNDFYNNANTARMGMQPAAAQNGQNGNHALQDYQMQLMLLEQQNKKRLLMARQEQDSMSHSGAVPGPNGGRGSPTPAMMDPNMNPALRQQMVMTMNNGGQPAMRPPSSHPMSQMTPQHAEMLRQNQIMQNGTWPGGQQPQGMMPSQPGQQPGQQPNMTPQARNMPPPPAPTATSSNTQPSSPAQPAAPPTPSGAQNKAKTTAKKDAKATKAANKKGQASTASEENAPPTPTPPPPVTPSAANSFNQNKSLAMTNGAQSAQQNNQNGQPAAGAVQPPQPEMNMQPFGALDNDSFNTMDFADLGSGNVLDNFDFDTFLNNNEDTLEGFDANFAFGDGPLETDGIGN